MPYRINYTCIEDRDSEKTDAGKHPSYSVTNMFRVNVSHCFLIEYNVQ